MVCVPPFGLVGAAPSSPPSCKLINSISTLGQSRFGILSLASIHFQKDFVCLLRGKRIGSKATTWFGFSSVAENTYLTVFCVSWRPHTLQLLLLPPSPSWSFWASHDPQVRSDYKHSWHLVPLSYSIYHNCNWIRNRIVRWCRSPWLEGKVHEDTVSAQ